MTPVTSRRQVQIGLELGGDPSTGRATGGSHPVPRASAGPITPPKRHLTARQDLSRQRYPNPIPTIKKNITNVETAALPIPRFSSVFVEFGFGRLSGASMLPARHITSGIHSRPASIPCWMPDLMASHGILLPSSSSIFSPNELAWRGLPVPLTVQWTPSP